MNATASACPAVPTAPAGTRLVSIDALRGFDMFWIVGAGALVKALEKLRPTRCTTFLADQLQHVKWEGFHFLDLIFPLFLFIVGVSTVFSLSKALAEGGRRKAFFRVARRSLLLFLFGVFYSGGITERWPNVNVWGGVLQRIALCYFFAATLWLCFRPRVVAIIGATLLLGYWAIMALVPFPDFRIEPEVVKKLAAQAGSESRAAIAAVVTERTRGVYEEERNLANYLDFRFLPGKAYRRYYANEGLLSTLPSIAIALAGIFAGMWLRNPTVGNGRKVAGLLAAGLVAVALGFLWSYQFPMIKRVWSSSFCLTAAGYSALLTAVFYLIVDVWQLRRWCLPLVWIGTNAITIYLTVNIVSFSKVAERLAGGDLKALLDARVAQGCGDVVIALVSLGLVFALARFLYNRKIFLRV